MWIRFNPNPTGKNVGDCAVRAVSKALGMDWQQAYAEIAAEGYFLCDMPSANAVWGAVLRREGFPDIKKSCRASQRSSSELKIQYYENKTIIFLYAVLRSIRARRST